MNKYQIDFSPYADNMEKEFESIILVENDGVIAAYGEAIYGVSKEFDRFIYLTWGTGIGGALVEKNPFLIRKIDWDIHFKEWEEYYGGKALANIYGDLNKLSDPQWDIIIDGMLVYIVRLTSQLNTNIITFGGGASSKQKNRLTRLGEKLSSQNITLRISKLNDDVGIYGGFGFINTNKT